MVDWSEKVARVRRKGLKMKKEITIETTIVLSAK